jgi:hypothetical protein
VRCPVGSDDVGRGLAVDFDRYRRINSSDLGRELGDLGVGNCVNDTYVREMDVGPVLR